MQQNITFKLSISREDKNRGNITFNGCNVSKPIKIMSVGHILTWTVLVLYARAFNYFLF